MPGGNKAGHFARRRSAHARPGCGQRVEIAGGSGPSESVRCKRAVFSRQHASGRESVAGLGGFRHLGFHSLQFQPMSNRARAIPSKGDAYQRICSGRDRASALPFDQPDLISQQESCNRKVNPELAQTTVRVDNPLRTNLGVTLPIVVRHTAPTNAVEKPHKPQNRGPVRLAGPSRRGDPGEQANHASAKLAASRPSDVGRH